MIASVVSFIPYNFSSSCPNRESAEISLSGTSILYNAKLSARLKRAGNNGSLCFKAGKPLFLILLYNTLRDSIKRLPKFNNEGHHFLIMTARFGKNFSVILGYSLKSYLVSVIRYPLNSPCQFLVKDPNNEVTDCNRFVVKGRLRLDDLF